MTESLLHLNYCVDIIIHYVFIGTPLNLKFECKKASVKPTALQNCTGKNTPWQTKPHQKLMEHKMCMAICIVTKLHLGKVCSFVPILF